MFKWFFAAAASLTAAVSPASASTYLFTVTGKDSAAFIVPSSPTVFATNPYGLPGFQLRDVAGSFASASGSYTTTSRLNFEAASAHGGFQVYDTVGNSIFNVYGDQVYSGTTASPTFSPGTYDLRDDYYGSANNDHLTITDITNLSGLLFTVTGRDNASFVLPPSPTVFATNPYGLPGFQLRDVAGSFLGANGSYTTTSRLNFEAGSAHGGFQVYDTVGNSIFDVYGDQVYSGTTASPTFSPGTYDLRDDYYGNTVNDHLTITALAGVAAAVPETETWLMMILGMGLLGCTIRHARSSSRRRLSKC